MREASWSACGKPRRDAAFAGRTAGCGLRARCTPRKRCRRCRLAPCICATAVQDAVALAQAKESSERGPPSPQHSASTHGSALPFSLAASVPVRVCRTQRGHVHLSRERPAADSEVRAPGGFGLAALHSAKLSWESVAGLSGNEVLYLIAGSAVTGFGNAPGTCAKSKPRTASAASVERRWCS